MEKELAGGATDTYEIAMQAGQFFHAVVYQMGIDVLLTLYDPDGKKIATMDSPNDIFGPEQISTVANSNGILRLDVTSGDEHATAGRYRITIDEPHQPTDADRARLSAERILVEAVNLESEKTAASIRLAIQKYESTVPLWEAAGDKYEQALALNAAGNLYRDSGNSQKALECFARVVELSHAIGDKNQEGAGLNNIGMIEDGLGRKQEALEYFNRSLALARAAGFRDHEAAVLSNIGKTYGDLGEKQKSIDYFNQALPLRHAAGDRGGEAAVLNNIGYMYYSLAEFEKALDYYNRALPLWRAVRDRYGEAVTLEGIGVAYDDLGESQRALEYFEQALSVARTGGFRHVETNALLIIGNLFDMDGKESEALDYCNEALPLARALGQPTLVAGALGCIANAYAKTGNKRKAIETYDQDIELLISSRDREREASAVNNRGKAYADLKLTEQAEADYSQALILARSVGSPLTEAAVLTNLMALSRDEKASAPTAVFFGKQAVNKYQQVRANIAGMEKESQKAFLKSKEKTYRELADLLIQMGRLAEAQEVLDLLKLQEYSDYSHHRGSSDSTTKSVNFTHSEEAAIEAGAPIQAEVTALGHDWSELNRKSSRTPEEQKQYEDLSERLSAANRRLQDYFNKLYEDFGKGDLANKSIETARAESSGLQNLLRGMRPGTVGLYTLVLDQKCVIMVITPAVMVSHDVPITKLALRTKVFAFVGALAGHQSERDLLPKAQDLYNLLIAPIEKDLAGAQATTLVWSLDDVLRYLPLAALHDGKHYFAERFSNVVFTTTSIGNLKDQPKVAAWRGLAMGVSKDYEKLGELKAVPGELDAVVTSAAVRGSHGPVPGTIMLDDGFTEKNMEAALDQPPPLVHIATHFVFNPGDDQRSYLLLGGKDEGGNGYHLSLADLRDEPRMNFADVELLTLSGCDTATGSRDSDGREVDSLGIVGQRKGAKAVVATLWKVDDASVGVLMETFYRLWTTKPGMTKSEALRQAQLSLLHGATTADSSAASSPTDQTAPYANPYYWAPFILIGNWK